MNKKGIGLMFQTIGAAIFLVVLFMVFGLLFDITGNALLSKLSAAEASNSSYVISNTISLFESEVDGIKLYDLMLRGDERFEEEFRQRYPWEFEKKIQIQVFEGAGSLSNVKTAYSIFSDELLSKNKVPAIGVIMNIEIKRDDLSTELTGGRLFDRHFIQLPGRDVTKKMVMVVSRG